MTVEMLRSFFGWCTLLNWGIMIIYLAFVTLFRGWTFRLHGRMFGVPEEEMRRIHYRTLLWYKAAVFLFNLAPYLALRIIA